MEIGFNCIHRYVQIAGESVNSDIAQRPAALGRMTPDGQNWQGHEKGRLRVTRQPGSVHRFPFGRLLQINN
jgi:hypothetical protein